MKTICSWPRRLKNRPRLRILEQISCAAALEAGLPEDTFVSVVFLDLAQMAAFNEKALGHKGATDVISFDLRTPGLPASAENDSPQIELYVCPDVAAREAATRGLPYERELVLYIVHGLLHMTGFDDLVPEKKRKMRRAEHRVMTRLMKQFRLERISAAEPHE